MLLFLKPQSQKVFTVEACASAKRMKQTLLETKQENDELETSAESAMWKISMTELHTPAPLMGGQTPGKQGFLPSSIDVAPRPRVLNFMPPVDEEGEIKANLANKVMTNPFKTILRVKADAFGNEEFLPVIDKGNLLGDCLEEGVVDSAFLRAGHIAFLTKSHQVYHLVITQAALSTGSIIGDAVKTLMAEQPSKAYQVLTVTLIPFVGGISIIRARGNTLVALGEEGSAYMTRFSEQNPQTLEKPKAIRAFEGLVLCSVGMSDNRILGSTSTIPSILKFANLDGTSAVTLEDQESVLITELEEGGKLSLPKARVSTFLAPGTNSRCLLQGFDKSGESLVYWLKDEKGGPGQCVGKVSYSIGISFFGETSTAKSNCCLIFLSSSDLQVCRSQRQRQSCCCKLNPLLGTHGRRACRFQRFQAWKGLAFAFL